MTYAYTILSSVACPTLHHFSHRIKGKGWGGGGATLVNIKCVSIFSATFVWNILMVFLLRVSFILTDRYV